jgi:hypothetical protein
MRLVFLTTNCRWVFLFGEQIVPMGDSGRLFETRTLAVEAARECGLSVDARGDVSC